MSSKRKANKKLEETSPVQEIVESLKDDVVDNLDFSSELERPHECFQTSANHCVTELFAMLLQ